jgi:hypothetical protein
MQDLIPRLLSAGNSNNVSKPVPNKAYKRIVRTVPTKGIVKSDYQVVIRYDVFLAETATRAV